MTPYAAHSALEPAGAAAAQSLRLLYAYFDVSALVFTLVIAALGFALGQKPKPEPAAANARSSAHVGKTRAVIWATVATVVALLGLLVASVSTGHATASLPT